MYSELKEVKWISGDRIILMHLKENITRMRGYDLTRGLSRRVKNNEGILY